MADIDIALITALRARTGLGLMECKAALAAAGGDLDAAALALRERSEAVAAAMPHHNEANASAIANPQRAPDRICSYRRDPPGWIE